MCYLKGCKKGNENAVLLLYVNVAHLYVLHLSICLVRFYEQSFRS